MRLLARLIPQPADARTALAMQRLFYEQSLFSLVSAVLMLALQSAYAVNRVPITVLGPWLGGAALLLGVRWHWRRRRLALDDAALDRPQVRLWQWRALLGSGLTGLMWAAALLMNFRADEPASQMFCAMLICITCVASISVMAPLPAAFWALVWPQALVLVPQFGLMAAGGRWAGLYFALLALAGTVMALALVGRHARLLHDSHALRFEREALLVQLQSAVAARSRFLAAASHDLRQPLHALGLLIDQVQTALHGRRAAASAAQAQRMVVTLDRLVGALLDLSRLDAGAVALQRQPVALAPLFDRLADELAPVAEARGLQWRVRPSSAWVDTDPLQFERILRNLLANAMRYTRQGGVLLAARPHRGGVRVAVWDTGPGIALQHQQQVFDEFVQLHNPGRDREQGLGLGLAIVQRLARLLGHPLGLRSRPGCGSCFHLDLPACTPAADALPGSTGTAVAGAVQGPQAAGWGLVALVEDDDAVREATRALLQQWGWQVRAAADADSLLARLQAEAVRPDRVVSDWRLARGDGLLAVAALREQAGQALPALVLSGESLDSLDAPGLRAQGITLARKPMPPGALRAWLQAPG